MDHARTSRLPDIEERGLFQTAQEQDHLTEQAGIRVPSYCCIERPVNDTTNWHNLATSRIQIGILLVDLAHITRHTTNEAR
jgi:hypothetical protein